MARVQFGWFIPYIQEKQTPTDYNKAVLQGLKTVSGSFDSAWVPDHLQFGTRPVLEGWAMLSYFSALAPQLKFGHGVLCQSYRNPALLAKICATQQLLSEGRFILGLGAGWNKEEYDAYNYKFPSGGMRVTQTEETLRILKALWSETDVTYEGKYYRVTNAQCEPKPQPLPPIMVAGFQPRMLRLIARHADWWNFATPGIEQARGLIEQCNQACEEVGRDPKTLKRTMLTACICAPTEREVEELRGQFKNDYGMQPTLVGTPQQVIEKIGALVDLGVDYFLLPCGDFPGTRTLETLVSDVVPACERL